MEFTTLTSNGIYNDSGNSSQQELKTWPYAAWECTLIIIAVGSIIVSTVVGNILVVLAVFSSQALRAPQNLFLVSLASADILVGALIIPFTLAREVMGYWHFGNIWCSTYLALDILLCTSSIVHLCAISIDRYWSVTKAVSYNLRRTPKRIKTMIAIIWVVSATISFPPLLKMDSHKKNKCDLNDDTWYVLFSSTVSFFLPCIIMIFLYCRIYRVAKHRASTVSNLRNGLHNCANVPPGACCHQDCLEHHNPEVNHDNDEMDLEDSTSSIHKLPESAHHNIGDGINNTKTKRLSWTVNRGQQRRDRSVSISQARLTQLREKRLTFVLAVVIGGFVICWFPFFFTYSLESVCRGKCGISDALFNFFFWIGYCNSSLNPVIYTVFNRDFRKAFRKLLMRRSKRSM
ncbi:PREDICTED: alpha-2Db adrenergic receptor-like [Nanorana parkeri]|uniref:alpha-2Db adrenergic receptor-like n=1 Tax=Nanorana parkeri TaxID=125878 RepID=UPI0008545D32|nr:PREDICTED: alpha-2Db adrenergic receptor-like [Nanorana parkeri]